MTGSGKRNLGHLQAWAVTSEPKAGLVQLKSGASKEGRRVVLLAHSKAPVKPLFLLQL